MPRSEICEAIILKTYDVGEADRFCILLTRQHGRIAARAVGCRRMASRFGGSMLPFRRLEIEVKRSGSGCFITSARPMDEASPLSPPLPAFILASEGAELLLSLIHDEEALPAVFALSAEFFRACATGKRAILLCFTLRLLHLLGLLPVERGEKEWNLLSPEEQRFLQNCAQEEHLAPLLAALPRGESLSSLADTLLLREISSPLRAGKIAAMLIPAAAPSPSPTDQPSQSTRGPVHPPDRDRERGAGAPSPWRSF